MAETIKYVLKSDRSKSVNVDAPLFSMARFTGPDGKRIEMPRNEFDQLYEPALPKAQLNTSAGRGGDDTLERIQAQLVALTGRVNQIGDKVDAIHAVAVPPEKANSTNED